jgi:hypothetical protein
LTIDERTGGDVTIDGQLKKEISQANRRVIWRELKLVGISVSDEISSVDDTTPRVVNHESNFNSQYSKNPSTLSTD